MHILNMLNINLSCREIQVLLVCRVKMVLMENKAELAFQGAQ